MRKILSEEIMQLIIENNKNISRKLQSASQSSAAVQVGADSWPVQCRRRELRRKMKAGGHNMGWRVKGLMT